jgi:hypothetical protein
MCISLPSGEADPPPIRASTTSGLQRRQKLRFVQDQFQIDWLTHFGIADAVEV